MKPIPTLGIVFALLALCSCQGKSTQNPVKNKSLNVASLPAQIDTKQPKDEEIKKVIWQFCLSSRKDESEAAIQKLREWDAKGYTKNIARLFKDDNWGVRANAARTLGDLGAKEYAKDISELLKDKESEVRHWAVYALGRLKAKEYADNIETLFSDETVALIVLIEAERVLKEWGVDVEKLKEKK